MNYVVSYAKFLKKFLKPKRKIKIILDSSNGTTSLVLREIFKNNPLVHAKLINQKLDGNFPAHGPNPLVWGADWQLDQEVKKEKADFGVIFDSDGDRAFFVDDKGRFIDPDESAFILMKMFKPPYVLSPIAGRLFPEKGIARCRIGHYYFKKMMKSRKLEFGAERSGHYYFKNFFYCDSGIMAALEFMNFVSGLDMKLSEFLDGLPKYYRSPEINLKVKNKKEVMGWVENFYRKKKARITKIGGLRVDFNGGWFNLRESNTENFLRLNLEVSSKKGLRSRLLQLLKFFTR